MMGASRQAVRISSIAAISSFIACDRAIAGYCRSKTANIREGEAASAVSEGVRSYALDPERAQGALGQERGDGRRALLIGARLDNPAWVRWLGITVPPGIEIASAQNA
jgi:hypothetical protein